MGSAGMAPAGIAPAAMAATRNYGLEGSIEGDELDIPTILREKKYGAERQGVRA
jgi:hypothetical protein